jgi:cobalt/nickel transport system permease protein
MHIPDGFLDARTNLTLAGVALVALAIALRRTRAALGERQAPLVGVTTAFIFAAQMVNIPIGFGTSGHLMGAALATILLGPWAAMLALGLVLVVQCLVFADGGLTALGSNITNIALVGTATAWLVFTTVRALVPATRGGLVVATATASWCSVVAAATACAIELGIAGKPLSVLLPALVGVHAVIGVGEAVITVSVVSMVLAARPDLVQTRTGTA